MLKQSALNNFLNKYSVSQNLITKALAGRQAKLLGRHQFLGKALPQNIEGRNLLLQNILGKTDRQIQSIQKNYLKKYPLTFNEIVDRPGVFGKLKDMILGKQKNKISINTLEDLSKYDSDLALNKTFNPHYRFLDTLNVAKEEIADPEILNTFTRYKSFI